MSSYGIGVTRVMAALAEASFDDRPAQIFDDRVLYTGKRRRVLKPLSRWASSSTLPAWTFSSTTAVRWRRRGSRTTSSWACPLAWSSAGRWRGEVPCAPPN